MQTIKEIPAVKNGETLTWESVLANHELDSMFSQRELFNRPYTS